MTVARAGAETLADRYTKHTCVAVGLLAVNGSVGVGFLANLTALPVSRAYDFDEPSGDVGVPHSLLQAVWR